VPPAADSLSARIHSLLSDVHAGGRGWTLLALAAGWFFVLGLRFVVPALLPFITDDFPVSNAAAGGAITVLWVTYALTQFPAGALVDRVGERRLLVASALLSAAGLAGYLGSVTWAIFLVATAAFGFGSGLFGPARGTVLTRTFPDRDGFAFGTVLAAGSVGAAALPVMATLLAGRIGWRIAIGLLLPGFLLSGLGLWLTVPTGTASGAVPDGGRVTVRDELAAVRSAISSHRVGLAVAAITLMLFAFQGLTAFLTTYLVEAKGLSEGTAGVLFGLLFLSGAVSQSLGGGLADRYGHPRVLAAVSFLSVPPLVALPFLSGLAPLAVVSAILGIRLSVGPISNAYIVSLLPVQIRGTAWGLLRTGFFTLGAFGSTAVGAMADRALFAEAFYLLAVLTAVAGVIYLFLPARGSART
jgi:predicted MFS family arabinose efflux permease